MTFHDSTWLALPELILAGSAMVLLIWGAFQSRTGALFTAASIRSPEPMFPS